MNKRIIELESIVNVRDLGGLVSRDGKAIRSNMLIRSAQLNKAVEKDLNILISDHRLSAVIDLRSDRERRLRPDIVPDTIDYLVLPVFIGDKPGVSDFDFAIEKGLPVMEILYRSIITSKECQNGFKKILDAILDHDYDKGSIMWHCTEGKDRCGLISAFIEHLLGISRKDIYEDYLLTNIVNAPKAERIRQKELDAGHSEDFANGIREIFMARKSYLDAALDTIDEEYGSMNEYLFNVIGIAEARIPDFRRRILE